MNRKYENDNHFQIRRFKKSSKAQAAMEFLMTYGWAILVVLVAIGALAYFGVLNPSKFLPSSCVVTPGISCDDHRVRQDGTATIVLRDGLGQDLTGVALDLNYTTTGALCTRGANPATMSDGQPATFTFTACPGITGPGSKYKANLIFTYTTSGGSVSHTKVGEMVTNVES